MTYRQAAQSALDVQDACNLSGIVQTLARDVLPAIWAQGEGTRAVNRNPIVTLYLLKLSELNGCGSTLHESYEPAERECCQIAQGIGD